MILLAGLLVLVLLTVIVWLIRNPELPSPDSEAQYARRAAFYDYAEMYPDATPSELAEVWEAMR